MFRNQYDGDISTWSPQGRLHQIEYAMEAVKQGSAAIGLKSKTHVIIAAIKRSTDELASYQRKVFKVDDHIGVAVAGLTADGRVLLKYMRNEAMNHSYVYDTPMQVGRLATKVADSNLCNSPPRGSSFNTALRKAALWSWSFDCRIRCKA